MFKFNVWFSIFCTNCGGKREFTSLKKENECLVTLLISLKILLLLANWPSFMKYNFEREKKVLFNGFYNIASKFVKSNSIARACFIFLLCMLMTSANKSLQKKNFPSG